MIQMTLRVAALAALLFAALTSTSVLAVEQPCPYSDEQKSFTGTPVEQATCLLRPVARWGKVGEKRDLPAMLASKLAMAAVDVSKAEMQSYLHAYSITEADIGGPLAKPLNAATRYFIIHDTSDNQGANPFPPDADTTWSGNNMGPRSKVAHIYVNRRGESATKVDLSENWRATKFENASSGRKSIAVSIELIQPRRAHPEGSDKKNDALAPTPGFTAAQYERLALIYVAASVRAGRYLIPAFHAVLDTTLPKGHDDPQNFDLVAFDTALNTLLDRLRGGPEGAAAGP